MTQLAIRYVPRRVHRAAVLAWHSHLAPAVGETLALGAHVGETLVGVVVLGRPALGLDDGLTWDVTRLRAAAGDWLCERHAALADLIERRKRRAP